MISTISAWFEVMKLIRSRDISKELTEYYRALSVNVMRKEGLFDFLKTPRTIQDIADYFGYTDFEYLGKTLEAYASDDILIRGYAAY